MIRPFRPEDAQPTRDVFVAAVRTGAAGRYSATELVEWLPDPTMPEDWGDWLASHITFVAEGGAEENGATCAGSADKRITGFMMLERSGYLNMAFVLPSHMGKGTADALYAATLTQAQTLALPRLHVLASRYAQSFFARQGWSLAPELTGIEGLDPRQGPNDTPVNRAMVLPLGAPL